MGSFAGLIEFKDGAPGDDLLAKLNEGLQGVLEVQHHRPAAGQGQHVDPETGLQRGMAEKLVQHHFGNSVTFYLNHHPYAVTVGFVTQIGYPLHKLVARHLGDALHQP